MTPILTLTIDGGGGCNRTRISVDQFHRFHVNIGSLGSTVVVNRSVRASEELAAFPVQHDSKLFTLKLLVLAHVNFEPKNDIKIIDLS